MPIYLCIELRGVTGRFPRCDEYVNAELYNRALKAARAKMIVRNAGQHVSLLTRRPPEASPRAIFGGVPPPRVIDNTDGPDLDSEMSLAQLRHSS